MNKELEDINSQIEILEAKKHKLLKNLKKNSTSLKEKAELWDTSDNKSNMKDLGYLKEYPNLNKYIRNIVGNLERHQTIYFSVLFEDDLYYLLDADEEEYKSYKITEEKKLILNEIFDNNLNSITIDW